MPSASEIAVDGFNLGEMNMHLLKKVEELTLYQIQLLVALKQQKEESAEQEEGLKILEALIK